MVPFIVTKNDGSDEEFTVLSSFGDNFLLADSNGVMKKVDINELSSQYKFEILAQIPVLEEEIDDDDEDEEEEDEDESEEEKEENNNNPSMNTTQTF